MVDVDGPRWPAAALWICSSDDDGDGSEVTADDFRSSEMLHAVVTPPCAPFNIAASAIDTASLTVLTALRRG